MWKCIRTINRLSPSTPNISSLPHPVWHVCYSAYNSTTWASSTFLAVMSNWQVHSPGWTHVTRELSEALTCLCTNYTCILMRVQLVLWKFAWKHRKTALCMRYVRSYQSAGQRTEHISRRIWCPSGIFETNWMFKMDWYWKVNAL